MLAEVGEQAQSPLPVPLWRNCLSLSLMLGTMLRRTPPISLPLIIILKPASCARFSSDVAIAATFP